MTIIPTTTTTTTIIDNISTMAFHTVSTKNNSSPSLPHELLAKVFKELLYPELADLDESEQPKSLDQYLIGRRALVACSLVDRQWYYVATSILWRDPIFPSINSFTGFLVALHPTIDPTNPAIDLRTPATELEYKYPIGCTGRSFTRSLKLCSASDILCRELDLNLPKFVRDDHVTALGQLSYSSQDGEEIDIPCFPNLETLSLAGCENVTDMSVIELVTQHARTLKSIDLSGCRHLTDTTVQIIANLCGSNLEELNLSYCGLISDAGVMEIAEGCANLQRLDISWCRRVGDRSLGALISQQLEHLNITGCRAITMSKLVAFAQEGSKNLTQFSFHCPEFPPNSQIQPTQHITMLFEALPTTLQSLSIMQANALSATHITVITERFPSLTSLALEGFRELSEETFQVFTKLPLQELRLPSCRRIDDCCLRILADSQQATSLRVLDISNSVDISDAALLRLAGVASQVPAKSFYTPFFNTTSIFPKLHTLLLTNNNRITIRSLVPAVRSLQALRYLDISGTGEGIVEPFQPIRPHIPSPTSSFGFRQFLQLHTSAQPDLDDYERAPLVEEIGDILGSGSLESGKKGVCVVRGWSACEKVRRFDIEGLAF